MTRFTATLACLPWILMAPAIWSTADTPELVLLHLLPAGLALCALPGMSAAVRNIKGRSTLVRGSAAVFVVSLFYPLASGFVLMTAHPAGAVVVLYGSALVMCSVIGMAATLLLQGSYRPE